MIKDTGSRTEINRSSVKRKGDIYKRQKWLQKYRNIKFTEIITGPITDEMSTNSRSVAGLGEMLNVVIEISQQNLRGQSSANITEIPNN